ncbi:hypothetical protein HK405_009475 [Cladochytrium tenue]|nr:hypothetical protein HK405_009475 [Cladochytrium tenue]
MAASTTPPPPPQHTFHAQAALPRLPIPPLSVTLATYLRSVQALGLPPTAQQATEAAAAAFVAPGGAGEQLQARLLAHDAGEPRSWLARWWLRVAYHAWREPLVVNSNWYMIVRPAPEARALVSEGSSERRALEAAAAGGAFSDWQVRGRLPPERTKAGPVCMDQTRHIFGVCRVPRPGCDVNAGGFPCSSRHIIVLAREQIYAVDVLGSAGERLPLDVIERAVVDDVLKSSDVQPPIGILTTEHRDTWAEVHEHMEKLSAQNRRSFARIESAIFAVALDDYVLPLTDTELGKNTLHGKDGRNRWFDSCLTWAIMADGRAGVNGEVRMREPFSDPLNARADAEVRAPEKLRWDADERVLAAVAAAQGKVRAIIADSDVAVIEYKGYGAEFMRKVAKVSPDAYTQMALQLTYFRLHGARPPVYESASTRRFLGGRTETTRSLSVESATFFESFDDAGLAPTEKLARLRAACTAHVAYNSKASSGLGCDRHLLGLRLCLRPGEPTPALFADPAYTRSQHWLLSTSALFQGVALAGTGFGAVVGGFAVVFLRSFY